MTKPKGRIWRFGRWLKEFWGRLAEDSPAGILAAIFTGMIFGVTTLYAGISLLQWREASRQSEAAESAVKQTRDNFRQDERPYIWLTNNLGSPGCVNGPNAPSVIADCYIAWDWQYTNYGKTPAYNLEISEALEVSTDGSDVRQRAISFGNPKPGAPLPPNKLDFVTAAWMTKIKKEDFIKLMDTENSILVRGK